MMLATEPRVLQPMRSLVWLTVLFIAVSAVIAVVPSEAFAQIDPPSPPTTTPCPPQNPMCGNPDFPPPPVPDQPPIEPPANPETPTTTARRDRRDGDPTAVTVGGFGDPLWFLPDAPDFEFAYDQQNYDLWLARCEGESSEETSEEALPEVFWELYGDAELACPDSRRAVTTLMSNVIGGDVVGRADIASSAYDIGADEGAWNHVTRKLWINVTSLFFSGSAWLTGSTINLLDWAFGFDMAGRLSAPANDIASGYYVSLNGSAVSLYDIALFITLCYFGIQLMRGRTTQAVGELAMSYLIYTAFVAFIVLVPGGFGQMVTNTIDTSGRLAGSIAAVTLEGQDRPMECPALSGQDLENVSCPFSRALHAAFIERPYDLLNWGTDLGSGGNPDNPYQRCAQIRDTILLTGPHGNDDTPRFLMGVGGCEELADFNHDPSAERAGLSLMVMLTAALVMVLAALTALTLIAAQLLLVFLVMVMPFAVVAGLLPGSGRTLLWRWVGAIAKVMMTVIGVAVFLSLYLVTISIMLDATAGDSWLIQSGSMVMLTLVMFYVRRRLLQASKNAGTSVGQRLSQARFGGGSSGFFTAASAGFSAGGQRARRPSQYIPYETRMAYRDARQVPANAAEWRTNSRIRRGIRTGRLDAETTRTPPRGFTASRRSRSQARINRHGRKLAAKAHSSRARGSAGRTLVGDG